MNIYSIYCITCKSTGKKYIGQTKRNINLRFKEHCKCINTKYNSKLANSIRKYGIKDQYTMLGKIELKDNSVTKKRVSAAGIVAIEKIKGKGN